MLGLLGLLALGFVIANLAMACYTVWMLTHPYRRTYTSAVARNLPGDPREVEPAQGGPFTFEAWTFKSRGQLIAVWDIQGKAPSGPVVIFVHGWGDSRIGALSRLPAFASQASRLIAWDLPGHGESQGTCSLGQLEPRDLAALIERLATDRPIVLVGWSLGAGVCLALAASAPPTKLAAIVAESPYRFGPTPARNVLINARLPHQPNVPLAFAFLSLKHNLGLKGFQSPSFDRAALAAQVSVPLLVLHGADDPVSPPADGRLIAQAAPNGEFLAIPNAGHHGLWTRPESATIVSQAASDFLSRHVPRQSTIAP